MSLAADGWDSLVALLAWKFTGQTETLATEALGYILSRSAARLRGPAGDVPDRLRGCRAYCASADRGDRKEGRASGLVAFDERGSERMLIEAEFWAGLSSKQPEECLERLPRDEIPPFRSSSQAV